MVESLQKILLVEDEPDIQMIAKVSLETLGGYEIRIGNNGQEALDILKDYTPDLIILDVMMPVMDGPATFAEIQNQFGKDAIPMVFMTAKVMADEIKNLKQLGAADVINKPFDPMTLSSVVGNIWKSWRLAA